MLRLMAPKWALVNFFSEVSRDAIYVDANMVWPHGFPLTFASNSLAAARGLAVPAQTLSANITARTAATLAARQASESAVTRTQRQFVILGLQLTSLLTLDATIGVGVGLIPSGFTRLAGGINSFFDTGAERRGNENVIPE